MKKFLKITGIILLILLVALFTAPFLFKGKIIAFIKTEINKNIDAKVDFADVNISLFRKFPRVSVAIEQIRITGNGNFSTDTLLAARKIDLALDLPSLIRGDHMTIYSLEINQPRIHAIVPRTGKANWDIMKEDTSAVAATEVKPFNLELKKYSLEEAYISYIDSAGSMSAEVINLNHRGSGDFTSDLFTLQTNTNAEAVNFSYGGIPYLVSAKTAVDADIQVDNKTNTYTFKTEEISVNELKLSTEGFFQLVNDSTYNMDIRFNAPSTDFKNILSLIPVVYQKDFSKVKTSGKAIFNGFVKGMMAGDKLPAYAVNLDVKDGFFQYPDLPSPVKNINLSLQIENPDGITDHTVVNMPHAHFEMENDPFDIRLLLRTPVSDMWVDAAAKGKLDLSKISRMVKLEQGTRIAGLLNADVTVKGFVDAVQKQQFDKFSAAGTIQLSGFSYAAKDYPDGVALDRFLLTFNPKNVTLNEAAGEYLKTKFAANGSLNNLLGYTLKNQPLDAVLNVKADKVNVNAFMGTTADTSATASSTGAFIVPANLDIVVNALVDQVSYDNLVIEKVTGSLRIADQTIKMENINGNALDGTLSISGSYSTRDNKKKPAIALQYDVKNLDVQKTFLAFNTVQKLMPIGKFLGGKLSSKLSVTGKLGENMIPDLSSLTGNGNIFLIEGLLQKFTPLEKLAERLNLSELKDITLREVREQFEFANGKVYVKPFNLKIKDIDMEIGGMHGFDQSLAYTIHLKAPREMMGTKGNQVVNDLISKAAGRGIPIKVSDMVNLNIQMLGTITSPDFKIDLKETAASVADEIKNQAKEIVTAKIDSAKKAVSDTLQSLKKAAINEVSERLKAELFRNNNDSAIKDTAAQKTVNPQTRAKESAKGLIENLNPFKKKKVDSVK